jgi:nucleotide-binding universal stress UspA family protein
MEPWKSRTVTYRILCGYDQSSGAEKAYDFALKLAKSFGGELHVLGVHQPAEAARGVKDEALLESAREHFKASFELLKEIAAVAGVEVNLAVSVGYPAQQILKKAEQLGVAHIVVGQRGKNASGHSAMGSVSRRIVSHGEGTVTVVR